MLRSIQVQTLFEDIARQEEESRAEQELPEDRRAHRAGRGFDGGEGDRAAVREQGRDQAGVQDPVDEAAADADAEEDVQRKIDAEVGQ